MRQSDTQKAADYSFDGVGVDQPTHITFDLAGHPSPELQGRLSWNPDELTLDLGMGNDVIGQILHELFFDVKNETGVTLTDGTPVMFAGTVGNSGRTLVQKAIADGSLKPEYIMGVITHDIATGNDGKVTWFGKVRGIDTTGTPYGETWADGDLLYISQTTAGYLTNIEPTSGQKILVAAVIHAHANGTILVRPSWNGEEAPVYPYVEKSANYTLTDADFTVALSSGSYTFTLPSATGRKGKVFQLKNSSTGVLTISPAIEGVSTLYQYENLTVQSTGSAWVSIM